MPPDHRAERCLQGARVAVRVPAADIAQSGLGDGNIVQMTQVVLKLTQGNQIGLRPALSVKGDEELGGVAKLFQGDPETVQRLIGEGVEISAEFHGLLMALAQHLVGKNDQPAIQAGLRLGSPPPPAFQPSAQFQNEPQVSRGAKCRPGAFLGKAPFLVDGVAQNNQIRVFRTGLYYGLKQFIDEYIPIAHAPQVSDQ